MQHSIRILFLADTHLGFDAPLRPKVQRRRRGDDFDANYRKALQPAFDRQVDMVVHGGDMFFRSRVHPAIVEAAFEPLLQIADQGISVFIVPGNHERSNIPRSLLHNHAKILIFEQPCTHLVNLNGCRIALAGFPNVRHDPGTRFNAELEKTAWKSHPADIRLLCMHQTVEGAQVGVQNYTFRSGAEVIRGADIPAGFAAVLSGHIHRHQVLRQDLAGRPLNAAVFYPGSTERTSFAEREEEKGYLILTIRAGEPVRHIFYPLPARPMVDLVVSGQGLTTAQIREQLIEHISQQDQNAVVRVHLKADETGAWISELNDRWLRTVAPATMNINWVYNWRRGGDERSGEMG